MEFLYIDTPGFEVIKYMRAIFCKYPGFNYVKIWADYVAISGSHMDIKLARNIEGRKFDYEKDFWATRNGILPDGKKSVTPGPGFGYLELAWNFLYIMALVFLLEGMKQLQASGLFDRLAKKLKKGLGSLTSGESDNFRYSQVSQPHSGDESVKEEFTQVKKHIQEWNCPSLSHGIVVAGLSKTYKSFNFKNFVKNCCTMDENKALKNVSFSSRKGEILAILGQNGAGKTTMINILTTRMLKTQGLVNIFGLDLMKDQTKIREMVSLCPQFDIYWPDLTVFEHLELFSKIRGIDEERLTPYVNEKIKEVGLEHRSDFRIKYLSGGMKRRLSIAIATIGDPKVIFLDEPTTGLDPVTQAEVMKLINVRN